MAYYPSPVDSPLDPHADFSSLTDALPVPADAAAFERRRLTPRSDAQQASLDTPSTSRIQMEKIGVKGEVVILGRKIRCKMCRSVRLCVALQPANEGLDGNWQVGNM